MKEDTEEKLIEVAGCGCAVLMWVAMFVGCVVTILLLAKWILL